MYDHWIKWYDVDLKNKDLLFGALFHTPEMSSILWDVVHAVAHLLDVLLDVDGKDW